jgi:hypothetical protein
MKNLLANLVNKMAVPPCLQRDLEEIVRLYRCTACSCDSLRLQKVAHEIVRGPQSCCGWHRRVCFKARQSGHDTDAQGLQSGSIEVSERARWPG